MGNRNLAISGHLVVATIFLALFSLPSCKSHPNLMVHQSDTLSVLLRDLPGGYPAINPFDHPYTIPPEAVCNILESLAYDAGTVLPFTKTHSRKVFTTSQAEQLAPELSKALSLAPLQQVTAFTIAETENPDRQTTGFVFVLKNEVHIIIENLRRPRYEGEQNTYQQPVSNWKLRPIGTQRLFARRSEGKGTMTNWIIAPLQ